jgi:hypothetical protein
MKKAIRVQKLINNDLGTLLYLIAELNPNTKLWVTDYEPTDVKAMSVEDLKLMILFKETEQDIADAKLQLEKAVATLKQYDIEVQYTYHD